MRSERNPIRTTQAGVRTFENNSGSDCPEFGVLKVDDVVFTPTDNANYWNIRQIFDGNTPTDDCIFGIAQTPIKDTKSGPVMLSGVTPCTINVSDENHGYAIAGTSVDKLESASSGPAQILWKESGTGDKNAVVRLSNVLTPVHHASDMRCASGSTYSASSSQWNLLDFYFYNPTNSIGNNTGLSGPDYSWSEVFDSRPSTYPSPSPPENLKLKKSGTYYGVMSVQVLISWGKWSTPGITVGNVSATYSEPDTGNNTWIAANSTTIDINQRDGIAFSINLYVAAENNTTAPTGTDVAVGAMRYESEPRIVPDSTYDGTQLTLNIPFYFHLSESQAPGELQPWLTYDSSDLGSDVFSGSSVTIEPFDSNDSEEHAKSWIRYIPDGQEYDDSYLGVATP